MELGWWWHRGKGGEREKGRGEKKKDEGATREEEEHTQSYERGTDTSKYEIKIANIQRRVRYHRF